LAGQALNNGVLHLDRKYILICIVDKFKNAENEDNDKKCVHTENEGAAIEGW
jgi:hypothetical protein